MITIILKLRLIRKLLSLVLLHGKHVHVPYLHHARIARKEAREYVHARALSRSVRTQEAHYLSFFYVEAHVVKRTEAAVIFHKMLNAYHGKHSFLNKHTISFYIITPICRFFVNMGEFCMKNIIRGTVRGTTAENGGSEK